MFKAKAEPLGDIAKTKKGGYIRKFLMLLPDGKKDVVTFWASADDRDKLEVAGVQEMSFDIGDMVFVR